ncbi:MAG TPA: sulfur carrier protein ThiS [Acidimicrobiales bacterium]
MSGGGAAQGGGSVVVTVNGERHEVAPGTTVASLLDRLGTEGRGVAVAVDGEVVARSSWPEHELAPGARVEILSIARGG